MESRFRHDFSRVRVHTDPKANESARALGAAAYTVGHDVGFAPPSSDRDRRRRRLLAHEMAHVVQQSTQLSESEAKAPDNAVLDAEATQASKPVRASGRVCRTPLCGAVSLACSRVSDRLPSRDITPSKYVTSHAQLNEAIPQKSGRKTVSVGLVEDEQGHQPLVYTVNGNGRTGDRGEASELGITRWQGTPRAEGRAMWAHRLTLSSSS